MRLSGIEAIERGDDALAWLFLETKCSNQRELALLDECQKEGGDPKQLIARFLTSESPN